MYIEHYNVYIANTTTKKVKKLRINADDAQTAHKQAMMQSHFFTEEITKITDSQNNTAYTIKDGFLDIIL